MKFKVTHNDLNSKARLGELETDHGIINTPIFMPVGTQGTVKAVPNLFLKEDIKAEIILSNTLSSVFTSGYGNFRSCRWFA